MGRYKIINDINNKVYIGLQFYGSYSIGYWKQITSKYKSVKRLIKFNPQFEGTEKDIQVI